jgi:hypothetical protein
VFIPSNPRRLYESFAPLTTSLHTDSKAGREESKVPVRRHEHGPSCNTTAQTEEEGRQDNVNEAGKTYHVLSSFLCFHRVAIFFPSFFSLFVSYQFIDLSCCGSIGRYGQLYGGESVAAGLGGRL